MHIQIKHVAPDVLLNVIEVYLHPVFQFKLLQNAEGRGCEALESVLTQREEENERFHTRRLEAYHT